MSSVEQLRHRLTEATTELEATRQAIADEFARFPGTSRLRGKQHDIRINASIHRGAQHSARAQRLEQEICSLKAKIAHSELTPVESTALRSAKFVKDSKYGTWHEVVRVNKTTVSVKTGYSWTDRIPHDRIVEVHK